MRLTDLEPCDLSLPRKPGLGVAFNCPGNCCARQRALQSRASELEAAGDPGAAAARHEAFVNQPFRVFVAYADRAASGFEQLYTRSGSDFNDITIAEAIDRTSSGHAKLRVTGGEVEITT